MTFRAVIFDWRGTLVTGLSGQRWVQEALALLGRPADAPTVEAVLSSISDADGPQRRLDAPGMDTDAALHRRMFLSVLADAGLDDRLAEALYAVESDPQHNPFAEDAVPTLRALHGAGLRLAVLSDIHVDVRPAFAAAGVQELVDVFLLSYERGLQKPEPALFAAALSALGTRAEETLMVGDRSRPDGAAVEQGIPTLLLPPLEDVGQRRLHHVLALTGVTPAPAQPLAPQAAGVVPPSRAGAAAVSTRASGRSWRRLGIGWSSTVACGWSSTTCSCPAGSRRPTWSTRACRAPWQRCCASTTGSR